jgi:hypothetical protein
VEAWRKQLRSDPIPPLLSSGNEALEYFVRRDLLEERVGPIDRLWQLPGALKILKKQQADGSWPHPGKKKHPAINYRLIGTWKQFRFLVEVYGFSKENPQAQKAAEFLFSCQSEEGDIRGMLANQYATYYTGAIMSLLIQAGYEDDPRIEKGFQWLLSMRQNDGGWSIPMITHQLDRERWLALSSQYFEPLQPDRSKPFAHNATGMVLRAFAAHKKYRQSEAARKAAELLASRFFQPDAYTSYQAASYWVKFQYPFWWNNLVAALDSISLIGVSRDNENVARAVNWLVDHQEEGGLWKTSYVKAGDKAKENAGMKGMGAWVSLAICRALKRLCG